MTDTISLSLAIVGVLIFFLGVLRLRHVSIQGLVFGLTGAIIGLLLGALASVPLSKLPAPFGNIMPLGVTVILTFVMMGVMNARQAALLAMMPFLDVKRADPSAQSAEATAAAVSTSQMPQILVDTSVIIDGRIADIATAGFVPGRLSVPRFVLAELQNIADSDDAMRRGRGRRGLDVLNTLRELPDVEITIIEDDAPTVKEVDAKLVALAQRFGCNVLTTDYNLNRVAQIQGVRVLNVNELSNAIRPVVLPGEELLVRVVQPGKERNQGVGYLADGTMIVVDNGDKLLGQEVLTEVTRVFQTVAGKMIFAVPRQSLGNSGNRSDGPKKGPQASAPDRTSPDKNTPDKTPDAPASAQPTNGPATDLASKPAGEPGSSRRFGRGRGGKRSQHHSETSGSGSDQRQSPSGAIEERMVVANNHTASGHPHPRADKPVDPRSN